VYHQLATYLSQYKQVTIPQVGSFELVPKPAMLDVASKLIQPPGYLPQYSDRDFVKEHQLNFLALDLNADKEFVREELENFGKDLKKRIQQGVFFWKGIGKLEAGDAAMVFYPDVLEIKGLQTIPAEKVLRKNVQHIVRRGEQEVVSSSFYEEEKPVIKERSLAVLIGWAVVILSVVFIAFYLYSDGFKATAFGTKMKVVPANTAPTHK
jgi:hypothetical protein